MTAKATKRGRPEAKAKTKQERGRPEISVSDDDFQRAQDEAKTQIARRDWRDAAVAMRDAYVRRLELLPVDRVLRELDRVLDLEREAHTGVKGGREYVKAGRMPAAIRRLHEMQSADRVDSAFEPDDLVDSDAAQGRRADLVDSVLGTLDAYRSAVNEILELEAQGCARNGETVDKATHRILRGPGYGLRGVGYGRRAVHRRMLNGATHGDTPADRAAREDCEERKRIRGRRAFWAEVQTIGAPIQAEPWLPLLSDAKVRKLDGALALLGRSVADLLADERSPKRRP